MFSSGMKRIQLPAISIRNEQHCTVTVVAESALVSKSSVGKFFKGFSGHGLLQYSWLKET